MSNEDLNLLSTYLKELKGNGLSKELLESILYDYIPKKDNISLIKYRVNETGNAMAAFMLKSKFIVASISKLNEEVLPLEENKSDLKPEYEDIGYYFVLGVLLHEIEHSKQYLMSEKKIEAPNNVLLNAYKEIFKMLGGVHTILPRPIKLVRNTTSNILYFKEPYKYFVERNASIESDNIITSLALYNDRKEISELYNDEKVINESIGYTNNTDGSIKETFDKLLMSRKFNRINHNIDLCEEDRVKYGFSISNETREKVLTLKNNIKDKKISKY